MVLAKVSMPNHLLSGFLSVKCHSRTCKGSCASLPKGPRPVESKMSLECLAGS